jgi:hypothetical protein
MRAWLLHRPCTLLEPPSPVPYQRHHPQRSTGALPRPTSAAASHALPAWSSPPPYRSRPFPLPTGTTPTALLEHPPPAPYRSRALSALPHPRSSPMARIGTCQDASQASNGAAHQDVESGQVTDARKAPASRSRAPARGVLQQGGELQTPSPVHPDRTPFF